MLPLGLLLIAQDIPILQKPLLMALRWIEAKWEQLRALFKRNYHADGRDPEVLSPLHSGCCRLNLSAFWCLPWPAGWPGALIQSAAGFFVARRGGLDWGLP